MECTSQELFIAAIVFVAHLVKIRPVQLLQVPGSAQVMTFRKKNSANQEKSDIGESPGLKEPRAPLSYMLEAWASLLVNTALHPSKVRHV